ncbi:gamma-glutamyltransferase, partial [Escherichia coli]|uniref:gamma-glutamyltransferase n=1 Tax=Escherichia coli TaxID=562 RepID=UPI001953B1EA
CARLRGDHAERLGLASMDQCISARHQARQRAAIGERARPADAVSAGNPLPFEHTGTTHFSVVDSEGNAVSNTYT